MKNAIVKLNKQKKEKLDIFKSALSQDEMLECKQELLQEQKSLRVVVSLLPEKPVAEILTDAPEIIAPAVSLTVPVIVANSDGGVIALGSTQVFDVPEHIKPAQQPDVAEEAYVTSLRSRHVCPDVLHVAEMTHLPPTQESVPPVQQSLELAHSPQPGAKYVQEEPVMAQVLYNEKTLPAISQPEVCPVGSLR